MFFFNQTKCLLDRIVGFCAQKLIYFVLLFQIDVQLVTQFKLTRAIGSKGKT